MQSVQSDRLLFYNFTLYISLIYSTMAEPSPLRQSLQPPSKHPPSHLSQKDKAFRNTLTLVEKELKQELLGLKRDSSYQKNQALQLGQLNQNSAPSNSAPNNHHPLDLAQQLKAQQIVDAKPSPTSHPQKSEKKQNIPNSASPSVPAKGHLIGLCSIIALSSFQSGYNLASAATIPISSLVSTYDMPFSPGLASGIINGIVPLGALFGSLANKFFMTKFTRKQELKYCRFSNHPVNLITLVGSILCLFLTVQTLLIGRFFIGFSCGIYTSIAPVYIRDISPKTLRANLGTFHSLGRTIGIVFCYALGLLCTYVCADIAWYIMFAFPGFLAILQSILIVLFLPESPLQMLQKNKTKQLTQALLVIYKEEFIQQAINEQTNLKAKTQKAAEPNSSTVDQYAANRKRAFLMALNVSLLRQMIGVNFLVVYAGQIMQPINSTLAIYTPLIINFIQLVGAFTAALYITSRYGRRPMLLFGSTTLTLLNFALAISFYFTNDISVIVFLLLTMMSFGSTFNPVSWPYPTQIIKPELVPYTTFLSWLGCVIITIFPPIIIEDFPSHNAYPLFFFFGAYSFLSSIYIFLGAKESKGMTYQQLIKSF